MNRGQMLWNDWVGAITCMYNTMLYGNNMFVQYNVIW